MIKLLWDINLQFKREKSKLGEKNSQLREEGSNSEIKVTIILFLCWKQNIKINIWCKLKKSEIKNQRWKVTITVLLIFV